MVDHMKYTFNGGVIKPAITIFRQRKKGMQDLRVWNPLFIQHAGYAFEVTQEEDNIGEEPEVKKIGDQINLDFTRVGVFITIYRICPIVIYIYIYIYISLLLFRVSFVKDLVGRENTRISIFCH